MVAVTAANISPTKRHRPTTYDTASKTFTPPAETKPVEEPFWKQKTTTVAQHQSSEAKQDNRVVAKQDIGGEPSKPEATGLVVDDVQPMVPALEDKVVKDEPQVFEPKEVEVAVVAPDGDLIDNVKEALGMNTGNNGENSPADDRPTMLTMTNLNMRAGPGTNYPSVQVLAKGLRVRKSTVTAGKWVKVEIVGTSVSGWVNRTYLAPERRVLDDAVAVPRIVPKIKEVETPRAGTPIRNAYVGTCDCPYDRMRNGSVCGGRSAYSRPGGRNPQCYY